MPKVELVEIYCDECGAFMGNADIDSAEDEVSVCYDCLINVE